MVVMTETRRKNARFRPAELLSCPASNHLSAPAWPLLGPEGAVDATRVIQWPQQGPCKDRAEAVKDPDGTDGPREPTERIISSASFRE